MALRRSYRDEPWPVLGIFGELDGVEGFVFTEEASVSQPLDERLAGYQTNPVGYLREILGFEPWAGRKAPGQLELIQDIGESVRLQKQGLPADKIFRVQAGHGIGKTYIAAGIVNWFFDCFQPSITTTTAPTQDQVEGLLWKNIKKLRKDWLPGRVFPGSPRMERGPDHFAFGRTTSNNEGKGSERLQGQHDKYLLFVVDEAEGVGDFVFDAIDAMMTGGEVIIVLAIGNPKTRTSRFHKLGQLPGVKNYRLSVLDFPNVLDGKDTVPDGTGREWVSQRIERWCEVVSEHRSDDYTFDLEWDVETASGALSAGTIFKPNAEFMFRVMGIAPSNLTSKSFISPGRYEAAKEAEAVTGQESWARIGVDCARFGTDSGTIYVRHAGQAWRAHQISQGTTSDYFQPIKRLALGLIENGADSVHVRVDGTGGFGSGLIDALNTDMELREAFAGLDFQVLEVHFAASANDGEKYDDIVTEMYAEAAETLKGLALTRVPNELEIDLTDRRYEYVNRHGRSVMKLEAKDTFKRRNKDRSPDDGDGFVLCVAPDHIFDAPYDWKAF